MSRWNSPKIVEISMNAEIGSYQDDADRPDEWPPFLEPERSVASAHDSSPREG